jgi:hypothetical protein
MTWTQILAAFCIAAPVAWSAYESRAIRKHRKTSERIQQLVTSILQLMEIRQDAAAASDEAILHSLENIHQRLSRPQNPADGGRPL